MSDPESKVVSRRDFLKVGNAAVFGLNFGSVLNRQPAGDNEGLLVIPNSEGYLLVDSKECAGCTSCMAACSLVHEGIVNLSLSRIQVLRNCLLAFPNDIQVVQCRQCAYPSCLKACPTGALYVDKQNGNVRTVDEKKCIGCEKCIEACLYVPSRIMWNHEGKHSQKCDLCANAPYLGEKGGPGGKQACVAVCPARAIKFTSEVPTQIGNRGYEVDFYEKKANVRGWK
jgi:protein NrfC